MTRFEYASMRRLAFGALRYTPERFGLMRTGDFLDAMLGHMEAESERVKSFAELLRTSTTLLWNIQQTKESALKRPEELWRFSWDKQENDTDNISTEDRQKTEDDLLRILKKQATDGNGNKQSEG